MIGHRDLKGRITGYWRNITWNVRLEKPNLSLHSIYVHQFAQRSSRVLSLMYLVPCCEEPVFEVLVELVKVVVRLLELGRVGLARASQGGNLPGEGRFGRGGVRL